MWSELITWYFANKRDFPWRNTKNPYYILISEVMLQQTQAQRVVPKYLSWIQTYPTLDSLAQASRKEVLALWSGLGYNSRAARLHTLAKVLASKNTLPSTQQELEQLPGIGSYTAGAILAFAYNKPGLFIDVNVTRVISRACFSKRQVVTRKKISKILLDAQQNHPPRDFGNALMDLGASVCKANNPLCEQCPIQRCCKTKGVRYEEQEQRIKNRQSPFKNSARWFRGRIIRELTTKDQVDKQAMQELLVQDSSEDLFLQALKDLEQEKIIVTSADGMIRIRDV